MIIHKSLKIQNEKEQALEFVKILRNGELTYPELPCPF